MEHASGFEVNDYDHFKGSPVLEEIRESCNLNPTQFLLSTELARRLIVPGEFYPLSIGNLYLRASKFISKEEINVLTAAKTGERFATTFGLVWSEVPSHIRHMIQFNAPKSWEEFKGKAFGERFYINRVLQFFNGFWQEALRGGQNSEMTECIKNIELPEGITLEMVLNELIELDKLHKSETTPAFYDAEFRILAAARRLVKEMFLRYYLD